MTVRYYQTSHPVSVIDGNTRGVEVEPPEDGAQPRFIDWPKFDEGVARITWLVVDD